MKFGCRPALALLLAVHVVAPAAALSRSQAKGAATLELHSGDAAPALALSGQLEATITVLGDKGVQVELPAKLVVDSPWTVIERRAAVTTRTETGQVRWRQVFTLAPHAPGPQPLQLASLRLREGDSAWREIAWDAMTIEVRTAIQQADSKQLRDITSVEELPTPVPPDWTPWLWLGLFPLALAVLAAAHRLRRKGRPAPVPPEQIACRDVDRLLALGLPAKGQGKKFVFLLAALVRKYLEERFDLPARRQTTAELLAGLGSVSAMSEEQKRSVQAFFEQADVLRYTPLPIEADACQRLAEEARGLFQ
jgi:hypothetical protein